jgi:hypothetical protein
MLPGFRFLFAAIMLSMSLLIFGLGAAALFRAAHESFASNSSWRATPDVPFAQRPETTLPMLAALRVEPVAEKPAETSRVAAAPAEAALAISEPVISDQVAALHVAEPPAAETAKTEMTRPVDTSAKSAATPVPLPVAEIAATPEAAPAAPASAEAAAAVEKKTGTTIAAAASDVAVVRIEPAVAQLEPVASAPVSPAAVTATATETPAAATEASDAATKIATLGGPPVDVIDEEALPELRMVKLPRARPNESAIKKRQRARRALHRRRLAAARARLLALQQLQANPFAQPQTFAQQNFATATSAPR